MIRLPKLPLETEAEYIQRQCDFNKRLAEERFKTSISPMVLPKGFHLVGALKSD